MQTQFTTDDMNGCYLLCAKKISMKKSNSHNKPIHNLEGRFKAVEELKKILWFPEYLADRDVATSYL
jgi:hypothetical protein